MALSTKKKNMILSDWKAGRYPSKTQLARHYKTTTKTISKIVGDTPQTNIGIVAKGVEYETEKKSGKSPQEIASIEKTVKERTELEELADDIHLDVLRGTKSTVKAIKKSVEGGTIQKTVTEGMGKGYSSVSVIDVQMNPNDYKNAQEAFDKALITAGKAARHAPKGDVNVNNTENNIKAHIEYIVEMPVEDNLDEVEVIEVDPIEVDE